MTRCKTGHIFHSFNPKDVIVNPKYSSHLFFNPFSGTLLECFLECTVSHSTALALLFKIIYSVFEQIIITLVALVQSGLYPDIFQEYRIFYI